MKPLAESSRAMLVPVAAAVLIVLLWALRDVVMLVAFSVLLAYALEPLVAALEHLRMPGGHRLSRAFASGLVVSLLVILVLWLAVLAVPRLVTELGEFVRRIPDSLDALIVQVRRLAAEYQFSQYVDPALESMRANAAGLIQNLGSLAATGTGKLFGGLAQLLGLMVLPVLGFYLLAEREAVQASVMSFMPDEIHDQFHRIATFVDRALKSYVRGQAAVCLIVGVAVTVILTALKFPFALLLGVVAGLAEIVPYLGAIVATVAIALTGYSSSLGLATVGVIAYIIINGLVALLVTPRVMGQHLTMHPFVVTVSILAGASLLGPAGALLALPGAAMLQALVESFAEHRGENKGAATD